jgi:hypothetical protein
VAKKQDATVVDQAGVWSLIVGALAFGVFWEIALFGTDIPWPVALSIHGLSITTIALGLTLLERSPATGSSIGWIGVALTIVGTFASFVLLALGLTLVAISLVIQPGWRAGPGVLVVGSIALFISYVLGARVGTEGAPDPSVPAAVLFGIAGLLIPFGLVLIAAKAASLMHSAQEERQ